MRRFVTLLMASLLVLARGARADCPQSTIFIGGLDPANPIAKSAPRCDTTFSIQVCDQVHSRYDVPAGLLIASIDQACPDIPGFPGISGLETVVEDDFHLVGQNSGLPVIFTAVLHLAGEGHNLQRRGRKCVVRARHERERTRLLRERAAHTSDWHHPRLVDAPALRGARGSVRRTRAARWPDRVLRAPCGSERGFVPRLPVRGTRGDAEDELGPAQGQLPVGTSRGRDLADIRYRLYIPQ
jgi:hypothetical protein